MGLNPLVWNNPNANLSIPLRNSHTPELIFVLVHPFQYACAEVLTHTHTHLYITTHVHVTFNITGITTLGFIK